MKNVPIVTTSPAVSPVIHGMLLIKPVLHSAAVSINILALVLINLVEVELLAEESIKAANVKVTIAGMVLVVREQVIVQMRKFIVLKEL